VNNVETLCNVLPIVLNGRVVCPAGLRKRRPEVVLWRTRARGDEASVRTTCAGDLGFAPGMKDAGAFKAIIPADHRCRSSPSNSIPASFDHIQKAGSPSARRAHRHGRHVCMVWLAMNLLHFYRHESCGKCTPCREGGDWLYKLLMRVERGEGQMKDIDLLFGVANNIVGKTLCAFGDAAATPVLTTLNHFRHEFEAHVREGRCTLPADWRARPR
jgi:NADH-quinone oxidoreductase subunit F